MCYAIHITLSYEYGWPACGLAGLLQEEIPTRKALEGPGHIRATDLGESRGCGGARARGPDFGASFRVISWLDPRAALESLQARPLRATPWQRRCGACGRAKGMGEGHEEAVNVIKV